MIEAIMIFFTTGICLGFMALGIWIIVGGAFKIFDKIDDWYFEYKWRKEHEQKG